MKKKMTLIELLVVVVILSMLAAIVMANMKDFKKESIKTAMNGNVKTLQTAVDVYSLKNNNELPVDKEVTFSSPQYINIERLYPDYIKSKLDYNNIKSQYYWVDVFGKVWGSTGDTALDMTNSDGVLEWTVPKNVKSYALYEIPTANTTGAAVKSANKIKLVNYRELPSGTGRVKIPLENKDSTYLVSTIDEYGLESAPVGLNYGGKEQFAPIFRGNGEYAFELNNLDVMYWDRFWTLEDKPEGTSIQYQFAVMNENGEYGEWTSDFKTLQPSKGLKIKITMKAFEGKYPSIYDIRVLYHYKDEPAPIFPKVVVNQPQGGWPVGGQPVFDEFVSIGSGSSGSDTANGDGTSTGGSSTGSGTSLVCGTGGTLTNIDSKGKILNGDTHAYVTYGFTVPKGQYIENIKIPNANVEFDYYVKNMWYEYSKNQSTYQKVNSLSEIPDESCVKVVYDLALVDNFVFPSSPKVSVVPVSPKVFVDPPTEWNKPTQGDSTSTNDGQKGPVTGVPSQPEPTDTVLQDPTWKTINTLKFFAHSGDGQITHWVRADINDVQPQNTRIVYRYSTSNGGYWSPQKDSISEVSDSRSLVVLAYLQIHKDYVNNASQEEPVVNSIKITHERGVVDLSTVKPTVTILPLKDNNAGRDVFSNSSKITWSYEAFDPRGLDIVNVEWDGDKRETYPVGEYDIKIRVLNSSNYWSDWVTYRLVVKPETPTPVISPNGTDFDVDETINWSANSSYDSDGDGIAQVEWSESKKSSYSEAGQYKVQLRVQDNEGNWSGWTEKTFTVSQPWSSNNTNTINLASYSQVIYVDQANGDDLLGSGSSDKPYKSLTKARNAATVNNTLIYIVGSGTYPAPSGLQGLLRPDLTITYAAHYKQTGKVIVDLQTTSSNVAIKMNQLNSFIGLVFQRSTTGELRTYEYFHDTAVINLEFRNVVFAKGYLTTPTFPIFAGNSGGATITKLNYINSTFMIDNFSGQQNTGIHYGNFINSAFADPNIAVQSSNLYGVPLDNRYNILISNWKFVGVEKNPNGTPSHLGVYGGRHAWYFNMDEEYVPTDIIKTDETINPNDYSKIIYVDTASGDDIMGTGSTTQPYKTITKAVLFVNSDNTLIYVGGSGTQVIPSGLQSILNKDYSVTFMVAKSSRGKVVMDLQSTSYNSGMRMTKTNTFVGFVFKRSTGGDKRVYEYFMDTSVINLVFKNNVFDYNSTFLAPTGYSIFTGNSNGATVTKMDYINNTFVPSFSSSNTNSNIFRGVFVNNVFTDTNFTTQNFNLKSASLDFTYNVINGNWVDAGNGKDNDGSIVDLGVYGGEYSWK